MSPVDPPPISDPICRLETVTLPGIVRQARRMADLSQRELAAKIDVSHSTVSRLEAGTLLPSVPTLLRILEAARLLLVVADEEGRVVEPLQIWDDTRDGGGKAFPAHLDLILDPSAHDWWGGRFALARPPETYHRSRVTRDARRKRSQWEVRVKQFRHDPPPPMA